MTPLVFRGRPRPRAIPGIGRGGFCPELCQNKYLERFGDVELPTLAATTQLDTDDTLNRYEILPHGFFDLYGDDAAAGLATVRTLVLPPGEGYAWCAGEAAEMAALRRVLVDEKGHDRHAIRAAAYWKRGATAHHETLED